MEIITGRTGTDHVYAADDAELYRMFIGSGDYVFRTGNQFNATMYGAYTIRVSDGSLMTQGRLAKIRPTDGYDELQFDVGVAGYRRADLVVAEYRKTVTTHEEEVEVKGKTTVFEVSDEFEDVSLVVIKGANNTGTYITPTYATGDIDRGEVHQVPLWEVRFNGVNFESLIDRRIFLDGVPYDTLIAHSQAVYEQANARVDDALEQVESEIDRLRTIIGCAPLTRIAKENVIMGTTREVYSKWVPVSQETIILTPLKPISTSTNALEVWCREVIGDVQGYRVLKTFTYGVAGTATVDGDVIEYDGDLTFTLSVSQDSNRKEWGITFLLPVKEYISYCSIDWNAYRYNPDDVFVLYLNGLRVLPNKYTVGRNKKALEFNSKTYIYLKNSAASYNELEIEIWRPETE